MGRPEGAAIIPEKNNTLTTFASSASVVELNSIRAWNWAENKQKAYLQQEAIGARMSKCTATGHYCQLRENFTRHLLSKIPFLFKVLDNPVGGK